MVTNGEIVSRVINALNLLNKDEHISRRYILSVLKEKTKFAVQQQLELKALFRDDSLYTWIRCVELKKDNIIKCPIIEFKSCKKIMRSVEKLPESIYSRYGNSVKFVVSLDGEVIFNKVTPRQYNLNKKRDTSGVSKDYFYVQDGYLYLPDSDVHMVDVLMLTTDSEELEGCEKCDECKSAWDYEFIGTDKFQELVIQDTIGEVARRRGIVIDENPNNDSNQKSQTNK
jgi:hypothetical protein